MSQRDRDHYWKNKERENARSRAYYAKNREEQIRQATERNFMSKYGITTAERDELVKTQGGACAICGVEEKLVVDHSHVSGNIRAMLCGPCNVGLGMFRDDPMILSAAAQYAFSHFKVGSYVQV